MDGARLELERPIEDAISRIRFAPRSNHLLISSWDSVLRLYDVDGSILRVETPSQGALLDCCFQDDSAAFSSSSDSCIRRHDLPSGTQQTVGKHDDVAICVEYSEETGQLISAGLDKKLMFWDMRVTNEKSGCLKMIDTEVESMSLCGLYLIAANGIRVNIYDLRNLEGPVRLKDSSVEYRIGCVRSFSNREGYVVGSVDGRVALNFFDPSRAREMGCVFRCHPKSKDRKHHLVKVNDMVFHPCHDTFVTGDNEGYAILWDAQSKKRLLEFPRYPNSVASLSYNHSGQQLAIASSFTYQEANEVEEPPQIFVHKLRSLSRPSISE